MQSIMDKKNYIVPVCSVLDLGPEGLAQDGITIPSEGEISSEEQNEYGEGGYLSNGFDTSNAWSYEWGE